MHDDRYGVVSTECGKVCNDECLVESRILARERRDLAGASTIAGFSSFLISLLVSTMGN